MRLYCIRPYAPPREVADALHRELLPAPSEVDESRLEPRVAEEVLEREELVGMGLVEANGKRSSQCRDDTAWTTDCPPSQRIGRSGRRNLAASSTGVRCAVFGGRVEAELEGAELHTISGEPSRSGEDLTRLGEELGRRLA